MSITMVISTLDFGDKIQSLKEHIYSKMEIALKVQLKKGNKVKGPITTPMAISTKDHGQMISNTEKERCSIRTEIAMKDNG